MATYMIGYDLHRPGRNYESLWEHLKSYGTWWHNLDSTWFVVSEATAEQILRACLDHVDKNDSIIVVQVAHVGHWYGIDEEGSDWLQKYL